MSVAGGVVNTGHTAGSDHRHQCLLFMCCQMHYKFITGGTSIAHQMPLPAIRSTQLHSLFCTVMQAGNTALHHAAIAANQAAAKLLLASGPRGIQALNMVNNKGRTPLHLAAVFGHHALVQMLAKQDKADVNIKDKVRSDSSLQKQ